MIDDKGEGKGAAKPLETFYEVVIPFCTKEAAMVYAHFARKEVEFVEVREVAR